jgi:hypothetical protein
VAEHPPGQPARTDQRPAGEQPIGRTSQPAAKSSRDQRRSAVFAAAKNGAP